MSSMDIPETLTIEQIVALKQLLKKSATKETMRKVTLSKYHKSEKGIKARKEAQLRYYKKGKGERERKKKEKLQNKINQLEKDLEKLKNQLITMSE
tara:strand:- start:140 stop:427 length:288 start_codon:yes stop_codon:yes gene_type:complete